MIVYSHSFLAMNTRFVMVIPGINQERGDKLSEEIINIVEDWEECLSRFRPGAELYRINASAFERNVPVSGPMGRMLNSCNDYYGLTGGLFDPAVLPVYNLFKGGLQFTDKDLSVMKNNCGWVHVNWDQAEQFIRFETPQLKIDFGGIGKGIALKDVVDYLKSEGVDNAFLSFGDSSIAGVGKHPYGKGWPVGIPQLKSKAGFEKVFLLRDEFLSTSGLHVANGSLKTDAQAHIYHPIKGELIEAVNKVMVKCDCPIEAEVLSTSGYMADESELIQLKKKFPSVEWYISN